jgi:hypothetical protein
MNNQQIGRCREVSRRALARGAAALAAVVALAGSAHAGDFCMTLGTTLYVGKAFSLPAKNRCKPFYGTALNLPVTPAITGSACTSANAGGRVDFALTEVLLDGPAVDQVSPIHHLVRIFLAPLGSGTDFFKVEGSPAAHRSAAIVSCPSPVVALP